ncbi:MAG: glucose-6-phosphate dehydrogenase assembly protein OpcA [Actinomycetes bacterium]
MTTTLWDTTGSDVVNALIAERRTSGAVASGLALSLIVVVDEKNVPTAEEAATVAAAAHPCRVLMVVRRKLEADDRLDAEISIGGRLGPTEAIVLRMFGRLTLHAESVVLPLLAPDAPVVTWWAGPCPDRIAYDPLGVLAHRRITDAAVSSDAIAALRARADDFAPGDTDLAWTRTTQWRSLLASAFDAAPTGERPRATGAQIEAESGNPSAALLAGWLRKRLGVDVELTSSAGPGITEVRVQLGEAGELSITRPDGRMATLTRTGQPDRLLPLPRRDLGDLLAEELRRLEVDMVYAEALAAATDTTEALSTRAPERTHVWRDPAEQAAAEPDPVAG